MHARACHHRGFTLIELLIVLAIIGLLVSLIVPAVQASRESARRAACTNHQRQWGVAFSNFESQQRLFPAAFTVQIKGPLVSNPVFNAHTFVGDLLPHLGQDALAAQYHKDAMFCAPENALAIATPIDVALCPSTPDRDPAPENSFVPSLLARPNVTRRVGLTTPILNKLDEKYSTKYRGAITDYSVPLAADDRLARSLGYAVEMDSLRDLPSMFPLPNTAQLIKQFLAATVTTSAFEMGERTRAAQITDGLSHTFMLTEVAGRPQRWQQGVHTGVQEPLASAWADPLTPFIVKSVPGTSGPCLINCDNDGRIYSFHVDGANFLFADGHVEFLADDIEPRTLVSLLTPAENDNNR